jgi:hypothetical protein
MDPVQTCFLLIALFSAIALAILIFNEAHEKENSFRKLHDLFEHLPKRKHKNLREQAESLKKKRRKR